MFRLGSCCCLPLVLSLSLALHVAAQEPPQPPGNTAGQANSGTQPDAAKEPPAREQTIYIPYSKLRHIFEKEGRGVFVPYDEFQRLWKAAREAARKTPEAQPPVSAIIAEIDSQASV